MSITIPKPYRIVPLTSIAGPVFCVPITTNGTHKDCDLFVCVKDRQKLSKVLFTEV